MIGKQFNKESEYMLIFYKNMLTDQKHMKILNTLRKESNILKEKRLKIGKTRSDYIKK